MRKLYSLYFKTKLSFSRLKFFMLSHLNLKKIQCNTEQEGKGGFILLRKKK